MNEEHSQSVTDAITPADFKKVDSTRIPKTPMRFLWFVTKPYKLFFVTSIIVVSIAQLSASSLPFILKFIVDSATLVASNEASISKVWFWGIVYIVSSLMMFAAWRVKGFLVLRFMADIGATGYYALFEYLSKHSHGYFTDRFAGSLSTKIAHTSRGTQNIISDILGTYYNTLLSFVFAGILLFITNALIGLIYICIVFILIPMNYFLSKYRRPYVVESAKAHSAFVGQLVDVTTNITATRHFSRRNYELSSLEQYIKTDRDTEVKQARISEWIVIINNMIIMIVFIFVVIWMLKLFGSARISLGDFIMVLSLTTGTLGHLLFIGNMMNGFIRQYGDIQEGLEEVLKEHDVVDVEGAKKLVVLDGKIEIQDMTFNYSDATQNAVVFDSLDLHIPAHQKVGVVGESGAGKTTLVSLLLRQHDLSSGNILIDRQNIAQVTQDSLREQIAVVPQEPLLFHRSIKENIRYGRLDADDEEIKKSAKMARAHEFIMETPNGYDTLVGERGVKLSGGQRQRIAIARAILKNAPILILDEATSALDSESEVLIQEALHELMEGKTVIAIAHRLSTLRRMDRIVVFENGKIVQDGTHKSLEKEKGVYSRLWSHQAGGFLQE